MLRPGRVAVGAVQVVAALAGRPAGQHAAGRRRRWSRGPGRPGAGSPARSSRSRVPWSDARPAGEHREVRRRPGRRGRVACTDGADPARRPQRGVLAPRADVGQLRTGRRDVGRPGGARRPRPPACRRRRPRAGSRPTRRPGRRRARAPPGCRRRASTSTPLSAPSRSSDAAATSGSSRSRSGRPSPASARWSAAASSSTPALPSSPSSSSQPVRVDAEPGRAHGQPAQVAGAVQALEQPRRAGVEPADDHGAGRVHAELEGAAVPPDPPQGRLELGTLRRHAGDPGTASTDRRARSQLSTAPHWCHGCRRRRSGEAADVEGEQGEGAGGGVHVGQRHPLVRRVREHGVAGAVVQRRDAAAPASSRRSQPYGAPQLPGVPPAGDGVVRGGHPVGQVAVGGQPAGRELPAPPLDRRRVVAQPRVGGAAPRPPRARARRGRPRPARPARRRAGPRPPAGPARWTPSRRPAPGRSTAGRPSPSGAISGSTSRLRSASSRCSAASSGTSFSTALTPSVRREACVARPGTRSRKVRAPALAVTRSSPVGSGTTQASARPAAAQRGEGAEPAVLLARRRRPAAGRRAAGRRTGVRRDTAAIAATSPAFMSQAPRPCSSPSTTRPENGSGVRPGGRVADRHDVDVPVEHQRRAVAGTVAGQAADQAPGLVPLHLDAGEVGRGEQLGAAAAASGRPPGRRRPARRPAAPGSRARRRCRPRSGRRDQLGQPLLRGGRARVDLVRGRGQPSRSRSASLGGDGDGAAPPKRDRPARGSSGQALILG